MSAAAALPAARAALAPGAAARRLSILHLITRLERGGSSDCTLLQALGAARRGHRVTVAAGPAAAPSGLLESARRQEGIRLVTLPALGRAVRPLSDLRALLQIAALLRGARYDVIHTHTSKAGALGRLAAALLGRRRRVVHQPHGHLFYGYYGRAGTAMVILAERLLARLAAVQIALTWRGVEEHLARGVGRRSDFRVVRSGIDLRPLRAAPRGRAEARRRLRLLPDDVVIGSLGRLEAVKGAEDLLEGFARAAASRPRLRLLLAGDGALRERLRERARALGHLPRLVMASSWEPPERILPALDLFVLASRNEGMGRALVEAMACGVPVVGCAVGGVPEVLEGGDSGLLVPPGDPESLARAIGRLADDRDLAADLGRRGRRRALAFGAGRMARTLLRVYAEVAP